MIAQVHSVVLNGLKGEMITIEVDIADGLPAFVLLGLPDASLHESRDRVRSALINSGFSWPQSRITVSLIPATIPKRGSNFDLPIAVAILIALGKITQESVTQIAILGELSLDGRIRAGRGVLASLISLQRAGLSKAMLSHEVARSAALIPEVKSYLVKDLHDVVDFLLHGELAQALIPLHSFATNDELLPNLDFLDVAGQSDAIAGLMAAAVGHHHLLMIGPPGAGKTMLAERLPSIMAPLSRDEILEVNAIHSLQGDAIITRAPFVAPHHTTTRAALVGGSNPIRPGSISLAHRGVLFIDEAPECDSGTLDSLREPMESGEITISRASGTYTFPADFLLVLAANPCPCGRFFGRGRACTCTSQQVRRYGEKLSGPLLDRIDIVMTIESMGRDAFVTRGQESSEEILEKVMAARHRSKERFKDEGFTLNSKIPSELLRTRYRPERQAMTRLLDHLDDFTISARGFHRILRLAWTFADLNGRERPNLEDVDQGLSMRTGTLSAAYAGMR